MTGHDYLLKWIKETYPLMDSADYCELDYYDMQTLIINGRFNAVYLVLCNRLLFN